MASVLLVFSIVIIKFCNCFGIENKYYPIFGVKSFQLNLNVDITYGNSAPSVTALDENIFAITWASSHATRNINYNENIYCRLFYIDDNQQEIQLLYQTIKINTLSNKKSYKPQILALSDENNQISNNKRFVIVWYCHDINTGNFDGIYSKIIRWDYEEKNANKISIIILSDDEIKAESKINDETHSVIGNIDICPIFDMNYHLITWLSWNRKANMFEYDLYSKVFHNYGSQSPHEFIVNTPTSKLISSPSTTPIYLSGAADGASMFFIAIWSVYDDISEVTGIYGKLLNGSQCIINETVMDNGIDVYDYNPSAGEYLNKYKNEEGDVTYLMNDYMLLVWNANQKEIHCVIYYVDMINAQFVNVYDLQVTDGGEENVIYTYNNPKVDTVSCYDSDINYKDIRNIENEININQCDISICYQRNAKTVCSFWSIHSQKGNTSISVDKYYKNDVQITEAEDRNNNNSTMVPDMCSWNRYYQDLSNPLNGKLLIVEQVFEGNNGFAIYGTVMKYDNWSLENPDTKYAAHHNPPSIGIIIVCIIVFLIFGGGVFYAVYYRQCKNKNVGIKNEIEAVNKKIVSKLRKLNPINKHRHHMEVSGVDTDDEVNDDTDNLELGNNANTKTVNDKKRNEQFQISNDSDSDTDSSSVGGIGGGIGGAINIGDLSDDNNAIANINNDLNQQNDDSPSDLHDSSL